MHVSEAIAVLTPKQTVLLANTAYWELIGMPQETGLSLVPPFLSSDNNDADLLATMHDAIERGEKWSGRLTFWRHDGAFFILAASLTPAHSIIEKNASIALFRDVTGELDLANRLHHAQKMEALGTLAAGIVHDFNNMLTPIMLHVDKMLQNHTHDDPERVLLTDMYLSATRARTLIRQILDYSRSKFGKRIMIHVSSLVRETLHLIDSAFPPRVRVCFDTVRGHDTVLADPIRLHQALMNIFMNAAQAMGNAGGTMTIDIHGGDVHPPDKSPAGKWIAVRVSDTGPGIAPAIQHRVFDPFFSTKTPGEGTGMGLAETRDIIRNLGGDVTFENNDGPGTTFIITLPQASQYYEEPATHEHTRTEKTLSGRILLVDNDPKVLSSLAMTLESHGCTVRAHTDSNIALGELKQSPDAFDVIIVAELMRGMDGLECIRRIKRVRPQFPCILLTAGPTAQDRSEVWYLARATVPKPVEASVLLEALAAIEQNEGMPPAD